jgi:hypothetical protein
MPKLESSDVVPARVNLGRAILLGIGASMLFLLAQGALAIHSSRDIVDSIFKLCELQFPIFAMFLLPFLAGSLFAVLISLAGFLVGYWLVNKVYQSKSKSISSASASELAVGGIDVNTNKKFEPSLVACLCHPIKQIVALQESNAASANPPYRIWLALLAMIVFASNLYVTSLIVVNGLFLFSNLGMICELSFYIALCGFGITALRFCSIDPLRLTHACLVSLSYAVGPTLILGFCNLSSIFMALMQAAGFPAKSAQGFTEMQSINICALCCISLVVCFTLAKQLAAIGVSAKRITLIWMFGFHATLAALIWLLSKSPLYCTFGLQG